MIRKILQTLAGVFLLVISFFVYPQVSHALMLNAGQSATFIFDFSSQFGPPYDAWRFSLTGDFLDATITDRGQLRLTISDEDGPWAPTNSLWVNWERELLSFNTSLTLYGGPSLHTTQYLEIEVIDKRINIIDLQLQLGQSGSWTNPISGELFSAPVPEPSTMILLGTGLVGLAGFGRKRFIKR